MQDILDGGNVHAIPQSRAGLLEGLALYKARPDKGLMPRCRTEKCGVGRRPCRRGALLQRVSWFALLHIILRAFGWPTGPPGDFMQNSSLRPDAAEPTATGAFLQELELHWTNNAGLRERTGKRYLPTIRRFLVTQFPTGEIEWTTLTPTAIAGFNDGAPALLKSLHSKERLYSQPRATAVRAAKVFTPGRNRVALAAPAS